MKNDKTELKTVSGPKAAVATFIRPRDNARIWVFPKKGESRDAAIARVMNHNGAKGGVYDLCA